ncbi:MAG: carbon storage regulator CsrA [Vulcanimicrobiota bacterium]
MLVLTRKKNESIIIDNNIEVLVLDVKGDQIRLGINAPKSIKIHRKELLDNIKEQNVSSQGVNQDNLESLSIKMKTFKK